MATTRRLSVEEERQIALRLGLGPTGKEVPEAKNEQRERNANDGMALDPKKWERVSEIGIIDGSDVRYRKKPTWYSWFIPLPIFVRMRKERYNQEDFKTAWRNGFVWAAVCSLILWSGYAHGLGALLGFGLGWLLLCVLMRLFGGIYAP